MLFRGSTPAFLDGRIRFPFSSSQCSDPSQLRPDPQPCCVGVGNAGDVLDTVQREEAGHPRRRDTGGPGEQAHPYTFYSAKQHYGFHFSFEALRWKCCVR